MITLRIRVSTMRYSMVRSIVRMWIMASLLLLLTFELTISWV